MADADGWTPSAGAWSVEDPVYGDYSGEHTAAALSLWSQTMTWGRLGARLTTQSWSGHSHNGFLVFDYQDSSNYKYAGMLDGSNKWVIKEAINGAHYTRAELAETITTGQGYTVEVEVSGDTATLVVDGATKVSWTFASGILGGQVGLRVQNAHTHFKEMTLKKVVNVTRYYHFNGQRVAMRKDGVVYYLTGDHLGSTSLVLDASGAKVAESRYYPYGETRWTWPADGTLPTDYRFTGARQESSLGLYHMGARWYDSALARWLSPDVIVPGAAASSGGGAATLGYDDQVRLTPLTVGFHEAQFLAVVGEENREIAAKGFWFQRSEEEKRKSKYQWGPPNPQALNRYAYCIGNPLRYVDPTGHLLEVWIAPEDVADLIALYTELGELLVQLAGAGVITDEIIQNLPLIGFLDFMDIKSLGDYFLDLAAALQKFENDPLGVWIYIDATVASSLFDSFTFVYGGSATYDEIQRENGRKGVERIEQPCSVFYLWVALIAAGEPPYQYAAAGGFSIFNLNPLSDALTGVHPWYQP